MTNVLARIAAVLILGSVACADQTEKTMNTQTAAEHRHTNRLADENSPYLLSHAHNPVDWFPWGEEALKAARDADKPIFLSIGYAACHWCHVMERESFEDESVAAYLNQHFVCIKVDREQRPDLDQIYMTFTTAMTGSGGWPMSVFLTPDLKPFFAGTYFPPTEGFGRPSFTKVIEEIATTYARDKNTIVRSAESIFDAVSERLVGPTGTATLGADVVSRAATDLMRRFDSDHGGFGSQPKFPPALSMSLWLRHYRNTGDKTYLAAAEKTLLSMARGGIYDHLGGGFARYATDRKWLVPHFEKMLYDNGLLIPAYVEAWQVTHNDSYLKVVRESLDWILREMTDPAGGFYSSLDADSEGEEGKFYVWSKAEVDATLGAESAAVFSNYYNVTERGNFESHNILNLTEASLRAASQSDPAEFDVLIADLRAKLLERRAERVRPGTDDKILTSWNGLALTALCRGYQVTGDDSYLAAAVRNASFVSGKLWQDGRLTHAYREGVHSDGQFLEDYAYYVRGLIDLYESDMADNGEQWLNLAIEFTDRALDLFMDPDGTFFLRPEGLADLIFRPKDEHDGATPAPGSIMIGNLFKLHRLTDVARYGVAGKKALDAVSGDLATNPSAFVSAALALDFRFSDKIEVVFVGRGEQRAGMLRELHRRFIPNRSIAATSNGSSKLPLFEGKSARRDEVTAYLCQNSACQTPVTTAADLATQLSPLGN